MYKKLFFVITFMIFLVELVSAFPQITNVSITPTNPSITDTIEICANIFDNSSKIIITRVNLHSENPLWNWGLLIEKIDGKYCKSLSPLFMGAYEGKEMSYYLSAMNSLAETNITKTFSFIYSTPFCGDGICNDDETCSICSNDCGSCPTPSPPNKTKKHYHTERTLNGDPCEPNWQCSGWGECSSGIMTRKCSDTNFCSYQFNKPAQVVGCEEQLGVTEKRKGILIGPLGISLLISLSLIILLIGLLIALPK
jgi:hypothetical protein